jgi:hypothetical protein
MCKLHWIFVGIATASMLLPAQDKGSAPTVPVQMTVTAEARHDHEKQVPVLNPGDVMAYQKSERLQVTGLVPYQGEHAGLELFILLDDASGMSLGSQLGEVRQFIESQPATTAIGIGYMQNGSVVIAQNLTTDHSKSDKALRLPMGSPQVMPSPFLALSDLIKRWPATQTRREVVLVSSGVDPLGGAIANPYLDACIDNAQRAGIIVYAIYTPAAGHAGHSFFRSNWGQNHLAQLAEETGGESYMLGFGAPVSFVPYFAEIGEHLTHQYLVTFQIRQGKKAELESVRFTTEVPNGEVVAASKVYVPAGH